MQTVTITETEWSQIRRLKAINAELLAALEALYEPRAKGWKVTDWDLRMEQARAAIAKARKE